MTTAERLTGPTTPDTVDSDEFNTWLREHQSRFADAVAGELDTTRRLADVKKSLASPADDDTDMNVLVVGDSHGDFRFMERDVIPHAVENGIGTAFQVGDFGFVWDNDIVAVMRTLTRLNDMLIEAGIKIHFLGGNHENWFMLDHLARRCEHRSPEGHFPLASHILYTGRTSSWTWDGVRIAAISGAVSIDRAFREEGVSWWQSEVLSDDEAEAAKHIGPVDLLLSHDAPLNIPLGGLVPDVPSQINRALMTDIGEALTPAWWIHGHYHASLHYEWLHSGGNCAIRSLSCNGASRQESMVVVNLSALRKGLSAVHYGGRSA